MDIFDWHGGQRPIQGSPADNLLALDIDGFVEIPRRAPLSSDSSPIQGADHTTFAVLPHSLHHRSLTPTVNLRFNDALTKILELFPDISHQYVKDLYDSDKANPEQHAELSCVDRIIEHILENPPYPKQRDAKRKRTHDDDDDDEGDAEEGGDGLRWDEYSPGDAYYVHVSVKILCNEFPHVPVSYVRRLLHEKRKFYPTYLALASQESPHSTLPKHYERLKRPRKAPSELTFIPHGPLARELRAAKKKVEKDSAIARQEKEREEAERLNAEEYTRAGALVECQCCYSDVPSNRAIPCEGEEVHFFCFGCIRRSAETQIGLMKHQVQCFDTSGCQASFSRADMEQAVGEAIMKKLGSLQQQDEISRAGLDGLEECPFCEFKAICPPVEEDREFRCCNPDCEIVSCRLCKLESHVPLTCEEARKEKGVSERHLVEEAMSEALIRNCPRCNVKIIKELGCNKMTCPQCKGLMCYVCKKDITRQGYNHFGFGAGSCRMDDDPYRHQEEVDQAEKATIEKIRAKNPELRQEELTVQRPEDRAKKVPRPPPNPLPHRFRPQHMRVPREPPPNYNDLFGPTPLMHGVAPELAVPFPGLGPFGGAPNPLLVRPMATGPLVPQNLVVPGPIPDAYRAHHGGFTGMPGGMPIGLFDWTKLPPTTPTGRTALTINSNNNSNSNNNPGHHPLQQPANPTTWHPRREVDASHNSPNNGTDPTARLARMGDQPRAWGQVQIHGAVSNDGRPMHAPATNVQPPLQLPGYATRIGRGSHRRP